VYTKELEEVSIEDRESIAQYKYDYYKFNDPYPEISPALLNPIDINKYIEKTGMISPFYKKNIKTVTYQVPLYGEIHYWENEERKIKILKENEKDIFILKPNAIIFIHISTTFRVPYYIAFRFNLKIDLVHKGLLLGTGPVVDPGFQGRILIPIHNLTANEYILRSGDGLIWVEFTKLSPYPIDVTKPTYEFPSFLDFTADDYFEKVNKLRKIESAIPDAMNSAKREAQIAKQEAESAKSTVKLLSLGAALTLFVAVGAIVYSGYALIASVITPTISLVDNQRTQLVDNANEIKTLKEKLEKLE